MPRIAAAALLTFVSSLTLSHPTVAGPYQDEFAKCLIESSSPRDNLVLIKWVSRVIAAHPDLKALSQIDNAQKEKLIWTLRSTSSA